MLLAYGVAIAGLLAGLIIGGRWFSAEMVAKRQLQADFEVLQQEQQALRQQLANAELTSEVDRKALESVRLGLATLQSKLANTQDELSFYRNLLQQEGAAQGLMVSAFSITPGENNDFSYRMVVQQRAGKLKKIKVTATLDVIGIKAGEEELLTLAELDPEQGKALLSLQFRYFYVHDGNLVLPDGFEAQKVRVKVWLAGQSKKVVEREFDWQVEEI